MGNFHKAAFDRKRVIGEIETGSTSLPTLETGITSTFFEEVGKSFSQIGKCLLGSTLCHFKHEGELFSFDGVELFFECVGIRGLVCCRIAMLIRWWVRTGTPFLDRHV